IFAQPSTSTFTSSRGKETLTTLSLVSGFPPVAATIRAASIGGFATALDAEPATAALVVAAAAPVPGGDCAAEGSDAAAPGGGGWAEIDGGTAGGCAEPPQPATAESASASRE